MEVDPFMVGSPRSSRASCQRLGMESRRGVTLGSPLLSRPHRMVLPRKKNNILWLQILYVAEQTLGMLSVLKGLSLTCYIVS